jgi:hypothetical protein
MKDLEKISNSTTRKHNKLLGTQRTVGDEAVENALAIGKQYRQNMTVPEESYLKLTSIETLLLSVVCSQGIPTWQENWEDVVGLVSSEIELHIDFTWNETAGILEAAAEFWYGMLSERISKLEESGEVVNQLRTDLESRRLAVSESASLRKDPVKLARKVIMLLEAVRQHCAGLLRSARKNDLRIGATVLNWNTIHLTKWSQSLGIFSDGSAISQFAIGLKPDIPPSSLFSEKACLTIFCQISQQTRLRNLYLKYNEDIFFKDMLPRVVKMCDSDKKQWEGRPSWWCSKQNDDARLISGVLLYGYGGFEAVVSMDIRFSSLSLDSNVRFDRLVAQERLDALTRELSGVDDRLQSRLMRERQQKERKNRSLNKQVGIDVFFHPRK